MAEEVPEDRPPQTDSLEQQPEQQQPEKDLAQPEEPGVAAESELEPEPKIALEESQSVAEQPSSKDVNESKPVQSVDTPEPSGKPAELDGQGHSEPTHISNSEALETSVPHIEGDEVGIENNDNDGTANQISNETQNAPEEKSESTHGVQDGIIDGTPGDTLNTITNDPVSDNTISSHNTTDGQHQETVEATESTDYTIIPTEAVASAEPTVSADSEPAEDNESAAPEVSIDFTEHAKPAEPTEPASIDSIESTKPTEFTEPTEAVVLSEQIAPTENTAASVAEETSHPQSSLGSPNFESYAFPETEAAAPVSQRTASIQNGDSSAQANPFATHRSFPNPESAPSTASSIQPSSSVSQTDTSIPRSASPTAATSIGQDAAQLVSLKPVLPPSPTSQPSSPSQRAASPIPQSHAQKATSSVHRNGGSVPNYAPSSGSFSPMQKLASPVQKPAYPTYRSHSPTPKVHSPLARPYLSPVMSPHQTMHSQMGPTMLPGAFPSHVSGFGGAFQSPSLSSSGYLPPYTQSTYNTHPSMLPQQPHAPSHDRRYSGYSESNFLPSFPNLRDLSMMNGNGFDNKGLDGKVHDAKGHMAQLDIDGENIFLLQRLNDAIPDLSRLLHGYRTTQNKLLARESEMKQMQAQYEQSTMRKDFYIEALQNQMRKAANDNAEETSKLRHAVNELRLELGDLDEKYKDLEETLAAAKKSNEGLSQYKAELECQVEKLNNDMKEEQEAHGRATETLKQEHADALMTQDKELTDAFEGIMEEEATAYREAMKALEEKLLDQQKAMKNNYEEQKRHMQEAYDALQADFDSKVAELESTQTDLSNTRNDLDAKDKDLEETSEIHINEIEAIIAAFEDKERQWEENRTDLETQLSQKNEELVNKEKERQKLEGNCNQKESQLQHAMEEMQTTMENMDKDRERLKKTLHSLGEATDLKSSKGDTFFLDSFEELRRSIIALSKEHFAYLPIDPPKSVLAKIPSELPSFLDNTPASRELRSAYIQHVISKTLNYRIFQPFLFTLGRRYDNADIFFQMLSMDIRRKSVRREAFWRQQTLKAAYTAPDAKHSINMTAAVIVDEVVDHIKHFADPTQLDPLVMGVRKIVKLAAETWRHARVERELIIATLPAPDAEGISNQDWEEYGTVEEGGGSNPSTTTASSTQDPPRHVLLRIFPQITREVAHEDLVGDGDGEKEAPCTYSHGRVLYTDSTVVMARRQELLARKRKSV